MTLDQAIELMILNHKLANLHGANLVADAILKSDPNNAIARFYKQLTKDEKLSLRFFETHIGSKLKEKPSPVIFDVGANEGQSIDAYRTMVPNAVIHSFEAIPELAAKLTQKYAGQPSVIINGTALGQQPGSAEFFVHKGQDNNGIGSFIPLNPEDSTVKYIHAETTGKVTVTVDTVDAYCARTGVDSIDFMKMDVQGFEPEVLAGAQTMLKDGRIGFLQVEIIFTRFYERASSFHAIEQFLAPHGYQLLAMCDLYPGPCSPIYSVDAFYCRDRG
jgi:FkbM family methyltransferase